MKFDMRDNITPLLSIPCPLLYGSQKELPQPYFSVVFPTYKRPELLKNAIMSAVEQQGFYDPYEIIVVDNEDTKEENATQRMISELGISNLLYYKNSENIQAVGNWNRCVLLARSKWVLMCHDDDWLKPDCLRIMKEIVEKHKADSLEIGYIHANVESWFDPKLNVQPYHKSKWRPKKPETALLKRSYLDVVLGGGATWAGAPTCGSLINRDALIAVGGYDQTLSPCPDCYVPYHMLGKYGVYKTYRTLGYYRWSENDTYKKSTLLGLIRAYNEFLEVLSEKHMFVHFFSNEQYADCAMYYTRKGKEAGIEITTEEINTIRPLHYSGWKLKALYFLRKLNSAKYLLFVS